MRVDRLGMTEGTVIRAPSPVASKLDLRENDLRLIAALLLASTIGSTYAQTVYKCAAGGKVEYSHRPCLDAKVVDTTPTQGLDKSSGVSRKGADVRAAENNKAWADALRPVLGEDEKQRAKRHKRAKLDPKTREACLVMDGEIEKPDTAEEVLQRRQRFYELGC